MSYLHSTSATQSFQQLLPSANGGKLQHWIYMGLLCLVLDGLVSCACPHYKALSPKQEAKNGTLKGPAAAALAPPLQA